MKFGDIFSIIKFQLTIWLFCIFYNKKYHPVPFLLFLSVFTLLYTFLEYSYKSFFFIFYSIKTKSDFESKIQSLIKVRSKNGDYLKQLYKEAYRIAAVFQLTRLKTEELEEKIAEVRRKFKVSIFMFFLLGCLMGSPYLCVPKLV